MKIQTSTSAKGKQQQTEVVQHKHNKPNIRQKEQTTNDKLTIHM